MNGTYVTTGEKIRARRRAANIKQYELAEMTGLEQRTIGLFERAVITPSRLETEKIAKALGCEAKDLQGGIVKAEQEIEHIGAKIRAMRNRKGMNREQLARLTGYSKGAINCWENRDTMPGRLQTICTALGCTVEELDAALDDGIPEITPSGQHVRKICKGCTFWQPMNGTRQHACHRNYWYAEYKQLQKAETTCDGFMNIEDGEKFKAEKQKRKSPEYMFMTDEELRAMKAERKRIAQLTGKIADMAYHNKMG